MLPHFWQKRATPALPKIEALSTTKISAQETPATPVGVSMSTAPVTPVTPVTPAPTENGFERFIDKFKAFVKKAAPIADEVAEAAKPILALTPIGPEYSLALTAIETAAKVDAATQAASGTALTGTQQMALAVQVANTGLTTILASKGITESSAVNAAITQFLQNVYNLQSGPAAVTAA
jgi:hypothetical protein